MFKENANLIDFIGFICGLKGTLIISEVNTDYLISDI